MSERFAEGQRIRLPDSTTFVTIDGAVARGDGWRLYVVSDDGAVQPIDLSPYAAARVEILDQDGAADGRQVLAALWATDLRSNA